MFAEHTVRRAQKLLLEKDFAAFQFGSTSTSHRAVDHVNVSIFL